MFFLGVWCFGEQFTSRAKRRVVCGRNGGGCEFGVCHGSLVFRFFFSMRVLRFWSNIYACWRLRFRNPRCTCDFFSWLLVLGEQATARAKRRVVYGQTGGGCEFRDLPRVACIPFFLMRVLRFWSNNYACWRLRVQNPMRTCDLFFLAFGALGSKPQRLQKGGFCAAALEEVARFAVCRGSLIFHFFVVACFVVLVYYIRLMAITGSNPAVRVHFLLLAFGALGASRSARKKASCMWPHWRRLRVYTPHL